MTDEDYELIAAAVLETARGRWFLTEHARRNRHADTQLVLQAIERLEKSVSSKGAPETDQLRFELVDMMNAITRTKNEIAAIKPPDGSANRIEEASGELDTIVDTTERATSDILASAERIQDIAWKLREQGIDATVCNQINSNAADIYTACSFQDLTGQRIRKVIQVLRFLEARIDAMIKIWRLDDIEMVAQDGGADISLVNGPALPGNALPQHQVDELIERQRREDVFWREVPAEHGQDRRNLGDFDLDDLEVFEVPPDGERAAAPATARERTENEKAAEPAKPAVRDGLESLSPAERIALFS
jgi:chemotaxis regulatin CheY-phosphate phosphatase CheZ